MLTDLTCNNWWVEASKRLWNPCDYLVLLFASLNAWYILEILKILCCRRGSQRWHWEVTWASKSLTVILASYYCSTRCSMSVGAWHACDWQCPLQQLEKTFKGECLQWAGIKPTWKTLKGAVIRSREGSNFPFSEAVFQGSVVWMAGGRTSRRLVLGQWRINWLNKERDLSRMLWAFNEKLGHSTRELFIKMRHQKKKG